MLKRLALALCLVSSAAVAATEAVPVVLQHQGRLLKGDDTPVDGPIALTIEIFSTADGETAAWSETYEVTPNRGAYAIALGDTKGGKKSLLTTDIAGERWVGVKIEGVRLLPRLKVGAVPFAVEAANAARLGGAAADQYALRSYVDAAVASVSPQGYAKLSGAAFTGDVTTQGAFVAQGSATVPAPTQDSHATTKKYVDEAINAARPQGYAELSGAAFTGPVTVPAPTQDAQVATKKYVDDLALKSSDPRLFQAQKLSVVRIVARGNKSAANAPRVINVSGVDYAKNASSDRGVQLLVLKRDTHQPDPNNPFFNLNYDLTNAADAGNLATKLNDTTSADFVLLVSRGPMKNLDLPVPGRTDGLTLAKAILQVGGSARVREMGDDDAYILVGLRDRGPGTGHEVIMNSAAGDPSAFVLLVDRDVLAGPSAASFPGTSLPNGNVGLGVASPQARLDVAGNVNVSGTLTVGGVPAAVPPGAVMHFALTNCPAGWVKANGQTLQTASYPALAQALGVSSASFAVPDLRGEFVRSADDGRGVDPGRQIGVAQAQDFKSFSVQNSGGPVNNYNHNLNYIPKSGLSAGRTFGGYWASPSGMLEFQWDGSEVRPRNVALLACIKH